MSAELLSFPKIDENRCHIEQRIRTVLDAHGPDICGFALVVWDSRGTSTADAAVKQPENGVAIPPILIPDFVRNRLLGEQIEQWAVDKILGNNLPPTKPPA